MKKHIEWVDGLKAIACIFIFTHHFLLAFLPSIYYGVDAVSHFKYDVLLSQSILSFPIVGNFWVFIFCILSGFVITMSFENKNNIESISKGMFKRYIHFVVPLFFISIIVFIFNKYNIFSNIRVSNITSSPWLSSFYNNKLSLFSYIKIAFIDTLFFNNDTLSTAFWMLSSIFYGTFLTYILCIIFNNRKIISYLFLLIPFIAFYINEDIHIMLLCSFIVGFLLAKLYKSNFVQNNKKISIILGILLLIISIFIGSYPTYGTPSNYFKIISFMSAYHNHLIGSSLFIISIILLDIPKKILSLKPFVKLGNISFEIYLIHIIILFSFSTSLFELLLKNNNNYLLNMTIVYFISLLLLIIVSIIFNKTITKITIKIEKILNDKTII